MAIINITTLVITPEILQLIASIDEFKGSWKALGNLAPERLSALRRVAIIESIGSSTRIEGSRLSDLEIEKLLNNISIKSFKSRDEQEVAGYAETMEEIFKSWEYITLTENHVRQLHRDLLRHSDKDERHRGSYKYNPNNVAAFDEKGRQVGIVFETASPFDTPRLMTELFDWTNNALVAREYHPLIIIAVFIVTFLTIHPFQDGNGRLSRMLTALLLLRCGYTYTPYSSLESVIENSKQKYYIALRQTQQTIWTDKPNWQPWLLFFLRALTQQMWRLKEKIEHEHLLIAQFPPLSLKILDLLRMSGDLSIGEIVALTGANRNTVKAHLRNLVKNNHLELVGSGRTARYKRK